jgi:hypothetical protein
VGGETELVLLGRARSRTARRRLGSGSSCGLRGRAGPTAPERDGDEQDDESVSQDYLGTMGISSAPLRAC